LFHGVVDLREGVTLQRVILRRLGCIVYERTSHFIQHESLIIVYNSKVTFESWFDTKIIFEETKLVYLRSFEMYWQQAYNGSSLWCWMDERYAHVWWSSFPQIASWLCLLKRSSLKRATKNYICFGACGNLQCHWNGYWCLHILIVWENEVEFATYYLYLRIDCFQIIWLWR
jgi:hypothetical protein